MSSSDQSAVEGLANAMGATFAIIAVGFVFTTSGFVSRTSSTGISTLVGKAALPPLLFKSVATLDLGQLNVTMLMACLITKVLMIVLASSIALVQGSRKGKDGESLRFTNAGVYGLFVTASNDLAIGLPIVDALYPSQPEFTGYLYLFVILQTSVVNPVCYALIEYSNVVRARELNPKAADGHVLRKVVLGLVTNPLVFCCALGLAYNLLFGSHLPALLSDTLTTLSNAFTAGALFVTGMSVVGRVEVIRGRKLLIPLSLTFIKVLVTPIVMRYLTLGMLHQFSDVSDDDASALSSFAYIYGSLPTGSTVVVIAAQFGADIDMVAGASVVCLLLSAPLMFVFSIIFSVNEESAILRAAVLLSDVCCWTGVAGCLIVFYGYTIVPRWRRYPWDQIMHLALVQFCFSIFHFACNAVPEDNSVRGVLLYCLVNITRLLARYLLVGLAYNLMLLLRCGRHVAERAVRPCSLLALGLALVQTLVWPAAGERLDRDEFSCWYAYGTAQQAVDQVSVFACLVVMGGSLYLQNRHATLPGGLLQLQAGSSSSADDEEELDDSDMRTSLLGESFFQHAVSMDGGGSPLDAADAEEAERSKAHKRAVTFRFRVKVLVCVSMLQLLLQVFLTSSLLAGEATSASVAQVLLVSVIVVDGQGLITSLALINHPDLREELGARWRGLRGAFESAHSPGFHSPSLSSAQPSPSPSAARRRTFHIPAPPRTASTMHAAQDLATQMNI